MHFVNVLTTNGVGERYIIDNKLNILGNSLFRNDWAYIDDVSSLTKVIVPHERCRVSIGNKHLYYGCEHDKANKAGYVLAVEHMYHEYRHVQQFTTEQKIVHDRDLTSSDKRMTDIIRRRFVMNQYQTIYSHTYKTDPSEMDAETYAVRNTILYFSDNPIITRQEAENIIFDFMMSEEYGHKEELEPYNVTKIDDIMAAFIDLRNKAVHIPYSISPEPASLFLKMSGLKSEDIEGYGFGLTDAFLNDPYYKHYRKIFNASEDGRDQDKILEQTIIMEYPELIASIPRLEKELEECKQQLDSRSFMQRTRNMPVKIVSYANPEINDGLNPEDADFTEAVNAISESSSNLTK